MQGKVKASSPYATKSHCVICILISFHSNSESAYKCNEPVNRATDLYLRNMVYFMYGIRLSRQSCHCCLWKSNHFNGLGWEIGWIKELVLLLFYSRNIKFMTRRKINPCSHCYSTLTPADKLTSVEVLLPNISLFILQQIEGKKYKEDKVLFVLAIFSTQYKGCWNLQ